MTPVRPIGVRKQPVGPVLVRSHDICESVNPFNLHCDLYRGHIEWHHGYNKETDKHSWWS